MPRYTADAIRNKEVLVVNIGAGTGTSALVNVPFEFSLKNVALLKPLRAALDGRYLAFYQRAIRKTVFEGVTRGGAQPFMGLGLSNRFQSHSRPCLCR